MTNLSSIVEILAKQALGGGQLQQKSSQQGGLADILGSVLGHLNQSNSQQNQNTQNQQNQTGQQTRQNGLGAILGSVLSQFGGSGTQGTAQPRSGLGGSTGKTLLIAELPLVLAWIQKQGGLQGALDKLKDRGSIVRSMIGCRPVPVKMQMSIRSRCKNCLMSKKLKKLHSKPMHRSRMCIVRFHRSCRRLLIRLPRKVSRPASRKPITIFKMY